MNLNNKVHQLIDKRWSPRAFDSKIVEKEKIYRVFEAARRAPSSGNEQPWRFLTGVKTNETWERIYSTLDEINQLWTKFAPILTLIVAKSNFEKTGKPNKHKFYDAGQAVAYLTFQATAEGLFVHQMAGFDPEMARKILNVPEGFEPITVLAMGYLGKPEILPERMQKNEHQKVIRKGMSEIVFEEWGKPFRFEDEITG